ncbi:MAG: 4-hydroxy-3-methylbut-2-enyl diphosphate reductase [Candidatus Omnitrophota bacterium]
MKINIAKSAGFCFGVKRALVIAKEAVASKEKIYMLGDIVHNEEVAAEIRRAGIVKINRLTKGKNKIFLIRAHGMPIATVNKAVRLGYRIIDATCPMVKEIHNIAKGMERRGYQIIVIGDKKHTEVHGIIGQLESKAIIIDTPKNIPLAEIKRIKKAGVVVQSTQNAKNVLLILNILKNYIEKIEFRNTICMPTRIKQEEIKKMPGENDLMLIIGSKKSANTKRLYEISKSINNRTFWINSKEEIKKSWFAGVKTIGITAGASTPDSTTRDIVAYIKKFS